MSRHCNGTGNCASGLRCSQTHVGNEIRPFCQIQECPLPLLPDGHLQISNVSYVGARIGVQVEAMSLIYTLQCCPNGKWSVNCSASPSSTSTSTPLTSSSTSVRSVSTSSTSPSTSSATSKTQVTPSPSTTTSAALKIDDKAWYVLQSSVETRQLANVTWFNSDKRSWTEAQRVCTANGGMLAHLYDAAEINVVTNWVRIESKLSDGSGSLARQVAYVKDYHKTWTSAQKVCAYNNGTMVHVYEFTDLEQVSVQLEKTIGASEVEIWTGGTSDPDRRRWVWSTGDPTVAPVEISPDVWGRFSPDPGTSDNCVLLNKVPGTAELKPGVCTEKKGFLCQRNIGKLISDVSWFILESPERRRVAVVTERLDWLSANKTCELNGARLANVYDQAEMNSLRDNPLVTEVSLWVGGFFNISFTGSWPQGVTGHCSSGWFWDGGTSVKPIDPSLWKDGTPPSPGMEDTCAEMEKKSSDFQVINRVCADLLPFLCQKGL